jgi:ectoine hydroxylase-related dioxygenase (phytanoyl-CoA dioxygenase family)
MELYCSGIRIDTSPARFGELRDSNDILDDVPAQRARMAQDGYLMFREFFDPAAVLAARREILLKYAIIGEVDSINHPVIEGILREDSAVGQVNMLAFAESVRTGKAYTDLVLHPALLSFYERYLGGAPRCFDFKWPRFVRPGEGTGLHCDIVYVGRGTRNLWSTWIPVGDVPRIEGSLMLLENSHRAADQLQDYWEKDADRDKIGWLSDDPVTLQRELGGRWLTTDFRAGDVICFSVYLAHASLDNRSPAGRCRLASDTRYQLASEPLDERWNGDISNPHGGEPKVFLPGLVKANLNREFEEEWKRVDERGRVLLSA